MFQRTLPAPGASADRAIPSRLDGRGRHIAAGTALAWCLLAGLPAAGLLAAAHGGPPLFAVLPVWGFLLATTLACRDALRALCGPPRRLRSAARLAVVLAAGAALLGAGGGAWEAVASALLLWLTAGRLLGRRARGGLRPAGPGSPGDRPRAA